MSDEIQASLGCILILHHWRERSWKVCRFLSNSFEFHLILFLLLQEFEIQVQEAKGEFGEPEEYVKVGALTPLLLATQRVILLLQRIGVSSGSLERVLRASPLSK